MHRRRGPPRGWRSLLGLLGVWLLALPALVALWPIPAGATPAPYAPRLHGRVVRFALQGLEPDFDPIYAVVLSLTLHDRRPAPTALPDATLVLDLYLESFQPDTTPLLPDLLHPSKTATHLVGFMQGAAALVNRGGQLAYRGDALAEVFADSSVHLVLLHLQPPGAPASSAELRLQGTLTLYTGGTQTGALSALTPVGRAALAVPPGPAVSWQRVIASLTVHVPPMVGTAGSGRPRGTPAPANNPLASLTAPAATATTRPASASAPTPAPSPASPAASSPPSTPTRETPRSNTARLSYGAALALIAVGLLLWWRGGRWRSPRGE